ncbi:MAG: hypothetical protein KGL39_56780 [Patescibacteria group bacterium]|nr:hypothetical protein [Patescibacteria group bacterium]
MTNELTGKISRWVAFGGAAVAALLATAAANEAQMLFGLGFSKELLLGYLTPITVGTFGLAWKWLEGRAAQEYATLVHVLEADLHLSTAVVEEIETLITEKLPNPPAAKSKAK